MYIKDRLRRSMMFIPGNNPGMIRDANIYGADSIMFDLEDSVAYTEKDAARLLVYNALKTLDFGSKETVVRINDLQADSGLRTLRPLSAPACRSFACRRRTAHRMLSTANARLSALKRKRAFPSAQRA